MPYAFDEQTQLALSGKATTSKGTTYTAPKPTSTYTPTSGAAVAARFSQNVSDAGGLAAYTGRDLTAVPSGTGGAVYVPTSQVASPPSPYNAAGQGIYSGVPAPTTTPPGTTPPTAQPEGPAAPGAPSNESSALSGFTEAEIAAALAAIEAEFGLTQEQLLQDQSLVGAQYRLLLARLNRQRALSAQAVTDDAVGRGIYRSGILGSNLAEVENQYLESQREADTQRLAQEQGIQAQLDSLDARRAAAQAQAQAGIRLDTLDFRRQAAGV